MEIKGACIRSFIVGNNMNCQTCNPPQKGHPALCSPAQAHFFKNKINRIFGTFKFGVGGYLSKNLKLCYAGD